MLYIVGMDYTTLIQHYGSVSKAARALDRYRSTLYNWRADGIPEEAQAYIEAMTNGALRADLPNRPAPSEAAV